MIRYGLVEQHRDAVSLTLLGRACGNSSLSYDSALQVIDMLSALPPTAVTAEHFMGMMQGLAEADGIYTPLSNSRAEQSFIQQASSQIGPENTRRLQQRAPDMQAYTRRCKRVCVLSDWIEGHPLGEMERKYTLTPFASVGAGEIRAFAEGTRYHLRSAAQIMRVLYVDAGPSDEDIEALLKEVGNRTPPWGDETDGSTYTTSPRRVPRTLP